MKKLILFAAILFAGVSIVKADGSQHITSNSSNEASTKLTVTLNSVQSILVRESNVNLAYSTIEHYKNGVSSPHVDHLNVYSTGGYKVSVKYENASDSYESEGVDGLDGGKASLFESVKVVVFDGTTDGVKKRLSTTEQNIIESDEGTLNKDYSIRYDGDLGNNYAQYIKGGAQRVYTADVTYTIAPK